MKIHIGSDHAGFELKEFLKAKLEQSNHEIVDHGTFSLESTDYPPYAHAVANAVSEDNQSLGILICGSANGVCITANKHQQIRAALCWNTEVAQLARAHNNANILGLPARFISKELALEMCEAFLTTAFEGGRHQTRVSKIAIQ
jgi:ribose 5-phosphate isomerase B